MILNKSSLVISAGTTAGVEPLMQNKIVLELGENPPYFNFENPPVIRIKKIDEISDQIKLCLNTDVPFEKIYSYFLALFHCSFPNTNNDNEITLENDNLFYTKSAQILFDYINNESAKRV